MRWSCRHKLRWSCIRDREKSSYFDCILAPASFLRVPSTIACSFQMYVTLLCLMTSAAHFEKFGRASSPEATDSGRMPFFENE
jgi:hypothetical protein